MKKLLIALIAVSAVSVLGSSANAAFDSKAKTSINFNVTFNQNPQPLILEMYSSPTLESGAHKIDGNTMNVPSLIALTDARRMILRAYLKIQPKGLYDVSVYTNNLNPKDNDAILDNTFDFNNDGTVDLKKPANYGSLTATGKGNWIGQYSGLYNNIMPTVFLGVKIWSPTTAGQLTATNTSVELIAPPVKLVSGVQEPDNSDPRINDYDCDSTSFAWYGNSKTVPATIGGVDNPLYNPGSYGFIPEKLAIDPNAPSPVEGSYRKVIAGTALGTDIGTSVNRKKLPIAFGIDQLNAGDGIYKGKIYLDMRSN